VALIGWVVRPMSSRKKILEFPLVAPKDKRLVIEHTEGPLKGLFRICGIISDKPVTALQGPLSVGAEAHIIQFASLIRVHPRWAHYRELIETPTGKFSDFHPLQV